MCSQLLLGWSSGSESLAPMIESQSACPGGNLVLRSTAQVVVVVPAKLLAVTYSKTSVAKAIWFSQSQVCGLCQTKARWQEVDQSQVAVGSSGKWQPKSLMVVAAQEKLSPPPTSGPSMAYQATHPQSRLAINHQHRHRRHNHHGQRHQRLSEV